MRIYVDNSSVQDLAYKRLRSAYILYKLNYFVLVFNEGQYNPMQFQG